jgi:two-component system sensor histidine kinase UhpB
MLRRKSQNAAPTSLTGLASHEEYRPSAPVSVSGLDPISAQARERRWSSDVKRLSLLSQIIAINAVLVTATVLVASVVANLHLDIASGRREALTLFCAALVILLANALLLRRRLYPLEHLIAAMEEADLTAGGVRASDSELDSEEVARLHHAFNRMLDRLEAERRDGASAVLHAQEEERKRLAQDLHDEVNQALTAISLRLEASVMDAPPALREELEETKGLVTQAMEELLHLSRELRPTALDDHGLLAALRAHVSLFGERTGIHAAFRHTGPVPTLSDDHQLVIYRVAQESLSNVVKHSGAENVVVELSFVGRTMLRISDDGRGLSPNGRVSNGAGGHGLSGMRERAVLAGGQLEVESAAGQGTTVTLIMS